MTSSSPSKAPVALVTGGARRLGRVIALELARRGWDVAVHYGRSQAEADETVGEIGSLGRAAVALGANLADEAQTTALIARCSEALGPPSCLVNNASRFDFDDAASFGYANFEAQMRVNAAAPLVLAREMHRRLLEADALRDGDDRTDGSGEPEQGVIVNLLDQKLFNFNPDFLSYTLSKAALHAATTMLAQALAPRIRVIGIAPGLTLPPNELDGDFDKAHAETPLGRSSTPEDIARAVAFAVESPAITGTTIVVDGGQHLMASPRDVMLLSR